MSFITNNEVHEHIRQIFGTDVEIREGELPLRVQPIPEDANGANPRDPSNCFFVHSIKRMYGSQIVIFFKKIAYLDMVDTDGVRRIYRYLVSKEATARLSRFDRGQAFPLGSAIALLKPPKSHTVQGLKHARITRQKKYEDRRRRLISTLDRKSREAKISDEQLKKTMTNEKKDAKKIAAIKRRKTQAEAAMKEARKAIADMDKKKAERAPRKFDLTTRNGALGNYNFSAQTTVSMEPTKTA
jgi:hypothetical protein